MAYALLVFATLATVEIFIRLPIIKNIQRSSEITAKSASVIRAENISDHWKERVLPAYSGMLFLQTIRLIGMLAIVFSPVFIALAAAPVFDAALMNLLVSVRGLAISFAAAMLYAFARLRFAS